jgi:ATP synthase protein I
MSVDFRSSKSNSDFLRRISDDAGRKLKIQRDGQQGLWFGLGMSGLIGWSVAVPTLGGILLGLWLDRHHPGSRSWTLMLLVAGLLIGCANAWHWISQQDEAMHDDAMKVKNEDQHG